MATEPTKITVWVASYRLHGVPVLVAVRAENQIEAVDNFVAAGFDIVDISAIRDCCIVRCPGPPQIQKMKEFDWIKSGQPILK